MDEVVKLLRTLQGIERVKEKIRTLVLNLNDIIDNDLSNLQAEVQVEINKILDFEKDCC